MEHPEGYVVHGKEDWVWRLKKGLYGLVQAGRTWNEELNGHNNSEGSSGLCQEFLEGSRFRRCGILGGRLGKELETLARSMGAKYGITGLGGLRWVLGILMERDRPARTISISQEAFIDSILALFNLVDASTVSMPLVPGTQLSVVDCPAEKDEKDMGTPPYREPFGARAWLATCTRPDIAFAISSLGPFLGTTLAAFIGKQPSASYGTSGVPRRGISSWVKRPRRSPLSRMPIGEASKTIGAQSEHTSLARIGGGAVSRKSKRQTCVALSSTEAEYMALCRASKEAVWMVDFLASLGVSLHGLMVVNADNQASIALAKNSVFHDRSKHVDIQYHYTRDLIKQEKIQLNLRPNERYASGRSHEVPATGSARGFVERYQFVLAPSIGAYMQLPACNCGVARMVS